MLGYLLQHCKMKIIKWTKCLSIGEMDEINNNQTIIFSNNELPYSGLSRYKYITNID